MNIVIVDDDYLVAASLKTIVEAKGVKVLDIGHDGKEGIELYRKYKPDVLLTDIRMEHMNGLEASEIILKEYPDAKILLLTTFQDDEYIIKALKLGVKGYILKQNYESIVPAIDAVSINQRVFNDEIIQKLPELMKEEKEKPQDYGLNEKEMSLIQQVADGLSNREIAEKLYLGEGTVRNYLSVIMEKVGVRDRTQLAIFYYQKLI